MDSSEEEGGARVPPHFFVVRREEVNFLTDCEEVVKELGHNSLKDQYYNTERYTLSREIDIINDSIAFGGAMVPMDLYIPSVGEDGKVKYNWCSRDLFIEAAIKGYLSS